MDTTMKINTTYRCAAVLLLAVGGQALAGDFVADNGYSTQVQPVGNYAVEQQASVSTGGGDWYIGAGAGLSLLEPQKADGNGYIIDGDGEAYKVFMGYNFNDRIGVEGYYADLGEAEVWTGTKSTNPKLPSIGTQGQIGYTAAGVHGVYHVYNSSGYGFKGKPGATVFIKGGVNYMQNTAVNVEVVRENDYAFSAGVGAEYKTASGLGVRIDGDIYDKDAAAAYISATAHFGGAAMAMMALPQEMYSDIDGDGIEDSADQCVNEPGSAENFGCPVQTVYQPQPMPQPIPDLCGVSRPLGRIYFGLDSHQLDASGRQALDNLARFMQGCPSATLDLGGNTCAGASEEHNEGLSHRRATAVADYLAARGVQRHQLMVNWYGESRPLVPNNSPRNMQQNRRVDIGLINR